jgi:hypothetical protein
MVSDAVGLRDGGRLFELTICTAGPRSASVRMAADDGKVDVMTTRGDMLKGAGAVGGLLATMTGVKAVAAQVGGSSAGAGGGSGSSQSFLGCAG